jgi:hypothetical protein
LRVWDVRWNRCGTQPALFYGKGNEKHESGTGTSVHNRIISASKRKEFVSNRMYAELIHTGAKTLLPEIHKFVNSVPNKEELHDLW